MGSLPRLETHQHRNYTGAQQAAPCTPHFFVLSQSLSAALHRPHAATDVVRLCAHLNQTLNHANSSVPHGMLPARRSEVNRNPGRGVFELLQFDEKESLRHSVEERGPEWFPGSGFRRNRLRAIDGSRISADLLPNTHFVFKELT